MQAPAADDPARLGRYRVVGRLRGDLVGEDETGRRVVLTPIPRALAAGGGFRDRFRPAVRAAAGAPTGFVPAVLDADPDTDPPWIATAYVAGPTLQDYVTANGPLGPAGTDALALRTADGLAALHDAGVAHGDLTPERLLLGDDGPWLLGLAVARTSGGGADPARDMAGFGAVLVFAATGRAPQVPDTVGAAPRGPARAQPAAPGGTRPAGPGPPSGAAALSDRLREVVAACLDPEPARRPTARQVQARLHARAPLPERTETLPPAPPPGPPPSPQSVSARRDVRSRLAILAAAVLAVLVVAGLGLAIWRLPAMRDAGSAAAPSSGQVVPASPTGGSQPATNGPVVADPTPYGADAPRFRTPSGNIACALTADGGGGARCDVAERSWQLPPTPPGCALAYGTGAQVTGTSAGRLTCAGDTVADPGLTVLPYGQALRLAGVTCVSRETGVRCTNDATGHGFQVARASYAVF